MERRTPTRHAPTRHGRESFLAMSAAAMLASCSGSISGGTDVPSLPPEPPAADTPGVALQNADFAFDFLRELSRKSTGNVFFSPHSISTAVAMVWAGSQGTTEPAIARTMHWTQGQDATHDAFAALANRLSPQANPSEEGFLYEWTSANRVWTSIDVLKPFSDRLAHSYASDSVKLDFTNHQAAATAINSWAERWTRGHINNIVAPDDMRDLRLMLTNAVYFKGTWREPFQTEATRDEPFMTGGGTPAQVPMMHDTRKTLYASGNGFAAVSLPYLGGVSCLFILPDETPPGTRDASQLNQAISTLSGAGLASLRESMQETRVALSIPKLSIKSRFSAREPLESLGMAIAFSDDADLTGIATGDRLKISDVLHAATVDMDEVGTVATAVTAIGVEVTAALPPRDLITFRLDRPYVLAIVHEQTGEVLFLGAINDPRP